MTAQPGNPYDSPAAPNGTCDHPQAEHWHGTHACYVLDKCRCDLCRAATHAYEQHRRRWAREFPYADPPLVDSARARRHVKNLMKRGMGFKRIAETAGVPASAVGSIIWGRHDRAAKRIRRETEAALLRVELELADGAKVDGTEARAIVEELLARGWTKRSIGRQVHGPNANSLQLRGGDVFVSTVKTLRRLLDEPVPPRKSRHGTHPVDNGYQWKRVPATTPGVPGTVAHGDLRPAGKLTCLRCGDPLATHPIGACMPTAVMRAGA